MPESFLDGQNSTMPVPVDIVKRPDIHGTIHVETASAVHPTPTLASSGAVFGQPVGQPNDVAGVLRRNQACLACRRRKLKCDAVRPHCSTCVRSYRHLLRTAPGTSPVLSCEYDDAVTERENGGEENPPTAEDEEESKKKKRKVSSTRTKKRDEELDVERDRLTQRITELEAQLAKKTAAAAAASTAPVTAATPQTEARWTAAAMGADGLMEAMPSPTAFLEMLSSAASNVSTVPAANGFPNIVPMWTSADRSESTGLTPYFAMPDPDEAATDTLRPVAQSPANMLSPNGVFSFSPAPSATLQWPASYDPAATVPPTTATDWGSASNSANPLQSVIQSTVRSMGNLTGIAQVNGSELAGPMIGPGASTPNPPPPPGASTSRPTPPENPCLSLEPDQQPGSEPPSTTDADRVANARSTEAAYTAAVAEGSIDSQILVDLFWPGWPANLPDPPIVTQLVETFFDLVPNIPRMLHRGRFLSRLALPPTHNNFPHPALLHAICAMSGSWIQYEGNGEQPRTDYKTKWECFAEAGHTAAFTKPSSMPFSLRQAAFGKDAVLDGLNTGHKLFDVVRAMIILARVFIDDTRMLECWTYTGLVTRMLLPLGLNVRSAELSLKSAMLPPPMDALEREERRIVVWMAMYHDTISSAASGWGTSLALDELTVPLPVSATDFDEGNEYMEPNPQDLESLDLYIKHPVPDPFVMTLKGTVLLNRVNKFARRWKNRRLRENDDLDGVQRPEFRELANAIACLQMSFPQDLQDPTKLDDQNKLDVNTITAHVIPQAAIICLYEPFADITDPNDQPARRILNAARAIINVIQQVVGVAPGGLSNLAAVMHSASSVALVTAARTCLLFYRHALNINDSALADSYRSDIETARMALAQYGTRFKIGYHHAQLIEYFLDRAKHPTYEKLSAHYPEHPRPGAIALTPTSNFGLCVMNALNIKRGFWKILPGLSGQGPTTSMVTINSVSPMGVSPSTNGTTGAVSPARHNSAPADSPPLTANIASINSTPPWTTGSTAGSTSTTTTSASISADYNSCGFLPHDANESNYPHVLRANPHHRTQSPQTQTVSTPKHPWEQTPPPLVSPRPRT